MTSADSRRHRSSLVVDGATPGGRDGVVLRLAAALRLAPRAFDPPPLFEPDEGGIERSLVEHQRMLGHLFEARRQCVGVQRPHRRQRPEHDQIQRFRAGVRRVPCPPCTGLSSGDHSSALYWEVKWSHTDAASGSPWCKSRVAPRRAMRPTGKARRARIPPVFDRGATPPAGMQRASNAAGVAPRAASVAVPPQPEHSEHHRQREIDRPLGRLLARCQHEEQ